MPRAEHGLQDPAIIAAMNAGDMAKAKSLAQKKLYTPLVWLAGIGAALIFLPKILKRR